MLSLDRAAALICHRFAGVEAGLAGNIAATAAAVFDLQPRRGEILAVPDEAHVERRRQYRSDIMLAAVPPGIEMPGRQQPALAITELDIFVPGLNYVFGETDQVRGTALISLARLSPEYYSAPPDPQLFMERAHKEAVHELGHIFGMPHCPNRSCIMHFSNTIANTDRKGPGFCDVCRARLFGNKNIRQRPPR